VQINHYHNGAERMQGRQIWKYLIVIFGVFWLIFALFLFLGDFPFYIISIALSTVLVLSALIVALAWAYQNNM
jgi:flagellar biosynthesis component FlhA